MSTSWLFQVSRETIHDFSDVKPCPEQQNSSPCCGYEVDSAGVSFSEVSICAFLTRSESTPFCTNHFYGFPSIFNKIRVSFQSHLDISHVNLDRSIQDFQLLRTFCRNEVVSMAQSFEISVLIAKECEARSSHLHGTILQHF